jgi:hypothetical protein
MNGKMAVPVAYLLTLIWLIGMIVVARADCVSIRDPDRRQACFAEERQSPESCATIRNSDDRETCRMRSGKTDLFGRPENDPWRKR